eukprot:TRINITY_DN11063_c0_g2_i1.p1 TRINITY_DN11063_c0_g2~~TRINITY_DN11063_c0_g2_i1.p1  ORF type:complete len:1196 (+),score=240.45 TRINITY_DN11063_c0_g2_i1:97-3684(+)
MTTNQRLLTSLRMVDKIAFNPQVVTKEGCIELAKDVLTQHGGYRRVGVPYHDETGKRLVLIVGVDDDDEPSLKEVLDCSDVDLEDLIDTVDQCTVFNHVEQTMTELTIPLTNQLNGIDPLSYSLRIQEPGTRFTTNATVGQITISTMSKLEPTYFDLSTRLNDTSLVHYGQMVSDSLSHSGDILVGKYLLHSVTLKELSTDSVLVPFLTGYLQTPLRKFEEQRPVLVVWDHVTKEVFVAMIPLDPVTIGDHIMCAPLAGSVTGGDGSHQITWEVLANACCGMSSVPSLTPDTITSLERARRSAPPPSSSSSSSIPINDTPVPELDDKPIKVLHEEVNITSTSNLHDKVVLCHTSDINPNLYITIKADVVIRFGCSFEVNPVDDHTTPREMILPCVVPGTLTGGLVLIAGKGASQKDCSLQLKNLYEQETKIVVAVVSDRMTNAARETNTHSGLNGIFIIVPTHEVPKKVFFDPKLRRSYLLGLNINAATALAGPKSLFVASLRNNKTNKVYFYTLDGVGFPGFIESPVTPCVDVTENFQKFTEFVESYSDSKKVLTNKKDTTINIMNMECDTLSQLVDIFRSANVSDLENYKPFISDALVELRMLYDDQALKTFAESVIPGLKEKLLPKWTPKNDEERQLVMSGEIHKLTTYQKHKESCVQANSVLQWLVESIGCLVSSKRTGSVGYNIARLAKGQVVRANLEKAFLMRREEVCDLIEENCTIAGCLVTTVDERKLIKHLQHVADNRYMKMAAPCWEQLMSKESVICWDRPLFDATTFACLMEMTDGFSSHPLARTDMSIQSFGMPTSLEDQGSSTLSLFLFDRFISMTDPYNTEWYLEADCSAIAIVRILLRGTISSSYAASSVSPGIDGANRSLGFFLVTQILSQIRLVSSRMTSVVTAADFDNSTCQIQRGLYGFLLCMLASTGTGISMCYAWELFRPNGAIEPPSVPEDDEWFIYFELVRSFHTTGWDSCQIKRNALWIIINWISVNIAGPLKDALRGETESGKEVRVEKRLSDYLTLVKKRKVEEGEATTPKAAATVSSLRNWCGRGELIVPTKINPSIRVALYSVLQNPTVSQQYPDRSLMPSKRTAIPRGRLYRDLPQTQAQPTLGSSHLSPLQARRCEDALSRLITPPEEVLSGLLNFIGLSQPVNVVVAAILEKLMVNGTDTTSQLAILNDIALKIGIEVHENATN